MKILFAFLLAACVIGSDVAQAQNVGDAAPDFTFSTASGASISLSSLRGRVVFLFLFGNQCPFCLAVGNRTETEINAVFAPTGKFVAVGLDLWDGSSSAATVNAFQSQTGITYPLLLKAGSIASSYSTTYDRVIVVDTNGIIQYKGTSDTASTLNAAKSVIQNLISQGSTATDSDPVTAESFLLQNYPNPFSGRTTIEYSLARSTDVSLVVRNLLGEAVRTLATGQQAEGVHRISWDGRDEAGVQVGSGTYFVTLSADGKRTTRATVVSR